MTNITILEVTQQIEVNTPMGHGRVWLVTEFGTEIEKQFTVILDNGQIWEFLNNQITTGKNVTMGRGEFPKWMNEK